MDNFLDITRLSEMIRTKRGENGYRKASKIVGLSASTIEKIEKGRSPDLESYFKLCNWLGVSVDYFRIRDEEKSYSHKDSIIQLFKSDTFLDRDVANALVKMVDLAYG